MFLLWVLYWWVFSYVWLEGGKYLEELKIQEYWSCSFSLGAVCFGGCSQATESVLQLSSVDVSARSKRIKWCKQKWWSMWHRRDQTHLKPELVFFLYSFCSESWLRAQFWMGLEMEKLGRKTWIKSFECTMCLGLPNCVSVSSVGMRDGGGFCCGLEHEEGFSSL